MTVSVPAKEWDKENMKTLSCRVRTPVAEAFRNKCETQGVSTHRALADFVQAVVSGENAGSEHPEERAAEKENCVLRKKLEVATRDREQFMRRAHRAEEAVGLWLGDDELILEKFRKIARRNGTTAEAVFSGFVKDYIVSSGHPENVVGGYPWNRKG